MAAIVVAKKHIGAGNAKRSRHSHFLGVLHNLLSMHDPCLISILVQENAKRAVEVPPV